jgi:hypothetical protein
VNLTNKSKAILIALIIVVGVGMFFVGQEVLAQEVVVTEINMAVDPGLSDVTVSAGAHRARVDIGALRRGYDVKETSGENLGAEVSFSNNMTIYVDGVLVFNRTMTFEKGTLPTTVTVYTPSEDVKPGANMTIVIDIELEVTLPTPEDTLPVPHTVTQTIHKEIIVPVED